MCGTELINASNKDKQDISPSQSIIMDNKSSNSEKATEVSNSLTIISL